MKTRPGSTTDWAWMSPDAASTKSRRTSLGGWLGDASGAADPPGAADPSVLLGAGEGAGEPAARPAIGWTRIAAIVLPSGDHQKLTTLPSRTVRTLPDLASSSRKGPIGMLYGGPPVSVAPIDAIVSPAGLNVTPAVPTTGIAWA